VPVHFIHTTQVAEKTVRVSGPLAHHLRDVLRCRVGETLVFVDEQPRRYTTTVTERTPSGVTCIVQKEETRPPEMARHLHLGMAMLKGERMDWAIQKATELGAARITPLVTTRTVARPIPSRMPHQQQRWTKIAEEAASQVGRWEIPVVDLPQAFPDFLKTDLAGFRLLFWEEAASSESHSVIGPAVAASPREGVVLIGPEGGWEKAEVEAAVRCQFQIVSLGPRIVRAETAVLAALVLVQYESDPRVSPMLESHASHRIEGRTG